MTFSKMAPRTSTPTGATKGKPKAAPTNAANRMNKEIQMSRLTVQTLAQMLADQQAATNAQMQTLGGIVADLAATVRAIIPAATVAAAAAPVRQMAQQQQQAAPVAPVVPVAAAAVAAPEMTARERNLANLARGRATAAANRAARAAANAPAATVAPAPVQEEPAAAAVAPSAPKTTALTRTRQNGTVVHIGTVGRAAYVVSWNRTAAAWDWQISTPKGKSKGRTSGDAARAAAFRQMNAAAVKLGAAQVRAGK